jgi:aminoglycoside phosphotransferase (APT) family kinase protein
MASIGDPIQDVSWWYWIDYINSVGLGIERLSGLPSLEDIYSQWHDITGLSLEHADYYDLFNITRYAVILERKFQALEKAGIGLIDNFTLPFLEAQLAKCKKAQ